MSKETIEAGKIVALATAPRNMPPNWTPPAPAWANSFANQTTPIVVAYFGTQLPHATQSRLVPEVLAFFDRVDAPRNYESAHYLDRLGSANLITAAYWTDPASYERWKNDSGVEAWWKDSARQNDQRGHFREILTISPDRLETIFSHGILIGVAKTGTPAVGPIREHNYWGSMRDRLPVSADNDLLSTYGEKMPRSARRKRPGASCASMRPRIYRSSVPGRIGQIARARNSTNTVTLCGLR